VLTSDRGCPTVNDHGALVTLAPMPASGDRLELGLAEFRSCLNARWQTYVLHRTAASWAVQGIVGPVVIA
jgi:hypothetical protein